MTKSTITRERAEQLANFKGAPVTRQEEQELASMALAAMDSEPVAYTKKHEISNMHATGLYLRAWPADRARNAVEGYTIPLYRHAQPAPVVGYVPLGDSPYDIPYSMPSNLREFIDQEIGILFSDDDAQGVWIACRRAAMLAAAPQPPGSEPATVPGKWIPVREQMPEIGDMVLTAM